MSRDRWSAGGGSRSRRGSLHHVYRGLIERNEPGKDAAESEVGLVEVVTDVFEPPAEPDRGRANPWRRRRSADKTMRMSMPAARTSRTRGLVISCISSPYRLTTAVSLASTNCELHLRTASIRLISSASSGSSMRRRAWSRSSVTGSRSTEVGRAAPLPPTQIVSKILQRGPHALIAEQGCSSFARCSGCWPHFLPADPGRIAPSIRPDLISGRDNPCCAGRPAGVCFFHAGGAVNRR